MSDVVISAENVSKLYRLGQVGTGSLAHDVNRWLHRLRKKEDPYAKIGQANDRTKKGGSDWVWALQDLTFEVKRGEVLGVIGSNGAGKSTLLKILSRVTAPTKGMLKIKGRIASLLEVGTGFHPELTGRENVYLNGAILGMRRHEINGKMEEIVEFSGCSAYIDTPVKRYSSGMYVRLAFAVAAHLEPDILVIDEVLAVGDLEFQRKCLGKMQDVAQHGRTVIFVSHNMTAVEALCRTGLVVGEGKILLQDTAAKAVSLYLKKQSAGVDTDQSWLLDDRSKRSGTGSVRLRGVRMLDNQGKVVESIQSGGDVVLEFSCSNETGQGLDAISLGFSLSTSKGEKLIIQYSGHDSQFIKLPPGASAVRANISQLPLAPGEYFLEVRIVSRQVELDWPRRPVAIISVTGQTGEGNAHIPESERGTVVLSTTWSNCAL